jgi:hypothetical protein
VPAERRYSINPILQLRQHQVDLAEPRTFAGDLLAARRGNQVDASSVSNRAELSEILTAASEGLLALPLDAKLASFLVSLLVPQGNIFDEFVERPVRRRPPGSGFVCLLCHAALLVAP